jgi:inner membrane protein
MALPIAHAVVGYVVHRLDWRRASASAWPRALAFMAIGNLPDVDFLVGFVLGRPGAYHRGITHTVVAAVAFGMIAATVLWWRRTDRWWPAALLCAAAYGSHLLVDAFTIDERGPAGAQFFWPFSDGYYIAPVTFFGEIIIDGHTRGGFLASIFTWTTVPVLAREAVIAAVVLALLAVVDAVRGRRASTLLPNLDDATGEEDLA